MELRHLRYFMAVLGSGSFTHAARQLRITQSTLSQQIKQLETELRAPLFNRLSRHAEATAAGMEFIPYCERVLREIDGAVLAVSELAGSMRGTLNMAVFNSFSTPVLGSVMSRFALRYPGVRVIARLLPHVEMERALIDGALDVAVAYASEDTEHIISEALFEENIVLVVGRRHRLAGVLQIPMRTLAELDLVLLSPEFGVRQIVDRYFASAKVGPHVVLEMNAIAPILSSVRGALLATVLSSGALGMQKGLCVIRLVDPTPKRMVALLWRRHAHRSAAATCMAAMIRLAYSKAGKLHARVRPSSLASRGSPHVFNQAHGKA
jgi:LysR family transcriptional regulator, cyn operon transcriptional activator